MINTALNYTGSKFKLLDQIIPNLDYNKSNFVDLFCGSFVVSSNVVDKYNNIIENVDEIKDLLVDVFECDEDDVDKVVSFEDDSFGGFIGCNEKGEGEFKILDYILNNNLDDVIIYSPDADMILLSSILPHDIYILRYDQQQNIDYIMSTDIFKQSIMKYITNDTKI